MAQLKVGSTVDGKLILDADDYTALVNLMNALAATSANAFSVGDGATGTKQLKANTAALNKPFLQYNDTTDKWEFSNDGTSTTEIGASGGLSKEQQLIDNLGLTATVGSNNLTVALKGADGNDPSASNIVTVAFRHTTLGTGTPVQVTRTSALSITLPTTGSLGFANSETGRLYVWLINYSGTLELALSRTADRFSESNLVTTTTIGTGSTSASTMYSTTGRSSVALRCIGYIEIQYGTANWTNAPSRVQVMGPGVKRTGDIVKISQVVKTDQFAASPGTATFTDVTGMSITVNLTSSINKVFIHFFVSTGTNGYQIMLRILRDSTVLNPGDTAGSRTTTTTSQGGASGASNSMMSFAWGFLDTPGVSAPVYKLQMAPDGDYYVCCNRGQGDGDTNTNQRGGSTIIAMEVMA